MHSAERTLWLKQHLILNLWPWIFFLLTFSVLIGLGCWQLARYETKTDLLVAYKQGSHLSPINFSEINKAAASSFVKVRVHGHFLAAKTLLLMHRYHQHRLGFEVITPFKPSRAQNDLLINRGWLPLTQLSKVRAQKGEQTLIGYLKYPEYQFILGQNVISTIKQKTYQIQRLNINEISQLLKIPLYPFVLRLNATQPKVAGGYIRDWKITTMSPKKHLGYAFQWFSMAIALCIAFMVFCVRRKP